MTKADRKIVESIKRDLDRGVDLYGPTQMRWAMTALEQAWDEHTKYRAIVQQEFLDYEQRIAALQSQVEELRAALTDTKMLDWLDKVSKEDDASYDVDWIAGEWCIWVPFDGGKGGDWVPYGTDLRAAIATAMKPKETPDGKPDVG